MYSENGRMLFLRALAAYSRNEDLVPLARVLYSALYLDPDSLAPIIDPSYSDAMYYAVECQDYRYEGANSDEKAEIYLRAGDLVDETLPHFAAFFYGDLPCAFWPKGSEETSRPAPLIAEDIPALVLGSTADPATPVQNGLDVFSRLADGYLVTETGGPHVIFGWGVACVDDLVTAFLVEGTLPDARETTCEGIVIADFYSLAPLSAADFPTPLDAMYSADVEIYYLPEYFYWDYITPTTVGCPFGGTLSFEPSDEGDIFSLNSCAFSEGFMMTGTGLYNYEDGSYSYAVTVSGLEEGTLSYLLDGDGNISVTGIYGGEEIDLSE